MQKKTLEILYEDNALIVIFKPEGMLSVPYQGSNGKSALEILEHIMRKKGTWSKNHKPLAVHRLDRDTSGVMMFAVNERAQKKIMDNWHTLVTGRIYRALAENPRLEKDALPESGTIEEALAYNAKHIGFVPKQMEETRCHDSQNRCQNFQNHRQDFQNHRKNFEGRRQQDFQNRHHHTQNNHMQSKQNAPKSDHAHEVCAFKTTSARTHYKIIKRGKTHTLFELSLDTGRKNQIRAHLASKGYPLCGDDHYRAHTNPFNRLTLHARTLEFTHPFTNEKMKFEVPEPKEWLAFC